jgi:hypothetical protein
MVVRIEDQHLVIRSHVARDLLQSGAVFKTDKLVVWEYVSNGLQYVDPGVNPIIRVELDSKRRRITIRDNGRGMDWADLQNFFVMHGENVDRRSGRSGRGRFGTGKSAAFGIADVLRITTVRDGRRSRVEVRRSSVQAMGSGDPIPVDTLQRQVPSAEPNGTNVEIEDIHLRALDQPGIIRYVEGHLARWPRGARVVVNNHECEVAEPHASIERRYRPDATVAEILGEVELILRASPVPLEEEMRGVAVYANGVWHATTLAGSEGREMAQYIFGEVDVPALDDDNSAVAPFDLTRSMQLNPNNTVVQVLLAFVGRHVDQLRRELVEEDRKRRIGDEARRLAQQAAEIARILNADFEAFRQRLARARSASAGGRDDVSDAVETEVGTDLVPGTELPAEHETGREGDDNVRGPGQIAPAPRSPRPPSESPPVPGHPDSPLIGATADSADRPERPRGGFRVEFANSGTEAARAKYVAEERAIYINVDHPQVAAAKGIGGTDDPAFRRLAYEVAFAEYAIAIASEMEARGEFIDPSDPIVVIRETINRVARHGAALYAA